MNSEDHNKIVKAVVKRNQVREAISSVSIDEGKDKLVTITDPSQIQKKDKLKRNDKNSRE